MSIWLSLLITILGAFGYFAFTKAESKELCRLAFFCGLLAFLFHFSMEAINILGK